MCDRAMVHNDRLRKPKVDFPQMHGPWLPDHENVKGYSLRCMPHVTVPSPISTAWCVVAHIFSGRRRFGDVHHEIDQKCADLSIHVIVISLDTAVNADADLLNQEIIDTIRRCLWQRRLAGAVIGTPCESWS